MGLFKKLFGSTENPKRSSAYDTQQRGCPNCGRKQWQENHPMTVGEVVIDCECTSCGHTWDYSSYQTRPDMGF